MNTAFHRRGVLRPTQVRGVNSAVVLQLLRRFEGLSRAEVARHSGLSEGTVSRIVSDLLKRSLVSEVGAENSTGGRPATRLKLSEMPLAIGVEIQKWETRFAVATTRGALLESDVVRTPPAPAETIELIAQRVRDYLENHGSDRVQGVGVTARGIVNSSSGVVEVGNAPGWLQIPLQAALESSLHLPIYVENDVRAAAIAEYNYTTAGEHAPHCLLYVRVDEGVGVGIVFNGQLYAGPSMSAGEFGQMVIADEGSTQRHDRPGCLEMLVSNQTVSEQFMLKQGKRGSSGADSTARVRRICQKALDGDADALEVLHTAARYLGIGIANIAWGLDPEVIIVNSTLNVAWPVVLEAVQAELPSPGASPTFRSLHIQQSAFGEQGTLIGAATLAFGPLFESAEVRLKTGAARS